MLSIIISSYQPEFLSELEKNIAETCDVPYEIISIHNPNTYSITEAYNIGISKAQYDVFLFIHEDILFHTKNWGTRLLQHFEDNKTGIIGVAGSSYVPKAPCGWHVSFKTYNHAHYIQNTKKRNEASYVSTFSEKRQKTFAVDGVFMAITRDKLFPNFFNEKIVGFHGYDLEFSLRIAKKYQNYVVSDILIEHFSKGLTDKTWFSNNIQIRNLYKQHQYQPFIDKELEAITFSKFFQNYMKYYGISLRNIKKSFLFYPYFYLKLSNHIQTAKLVYYYLKYKKNYQEKYNNNNSIDGKP